MPKVYSSDVPDLIKSLSAVEKAYIKKFAFRNSTKSNPLYLSLFNEIDKQKVYNEKLILKNLKYSKQLPQLKKYLYSAICKALDSYHAESSPKLQLVKMISMIEILYEKGLESQCWKLLVNAKKIAITHEMYPYMVELLQWERILSRKLEKESEEIYLEEQKYLRHLKIISDYSELGTKVSDFAHRNLPIRTDAELEELKKITDNPLFKNNKIPLTWKAKICFYEINGTFFDLTGDFHQSYLYRRDCLNLFERYPEKKLLESLSYLVTLNNYLVILIPLKKHKEIDKCISLFKSFPKSQLNKVNNRSGVMLLYTNMLDYYLTKGEFGKGEKLIKELESFWEYQGKILKRIELPLFINIALIYFGANNFSNTLFWLNKIIANDSVYPRNDVICFARILNLITHFELGNIDMLEHTVKSTYRFLYKKKGLHKFETAILNFIRIKLPHIFSKKELIAAFIELKEELEEVVKDSLQQKALESFDFISWLESKIENRPFGEILREKSRLL